MSPSKVVLSTSRQTQKTTANFQEGPSEGTSRIHLREERFGQGGAGVDFTYGYTGACEQI